MTNLIRMCIGDVTQYGRIIRIEQKYRRDTNTESVRRRTVLSFFQGKLARTVHRTFGYD